MKARLVLACAATGFFVSVFSGTASAEETPTGSIGLIPDVARPGETVHIHGTCDAPGFTTVPVMSSVLDAPDLYGHDDGIGGMVLTSNATVRPDATPEIWQVSFGCGSTMVTGYLRIVVEKTPQAAAPPVKKAPSVKTAPASTSSPASESAPVAEPAPPVTGAEVAAPPVRQSPAGWVLPAAGGTTGLFLAGLGGLLYRLRLRATPGDVR